MSLSLIVPAWMMGPAALAETTAVDLAEAAGPAQAVGPAEAAGLGPALAAAVIPAQAASLPAAAISAELLPETTADPHLLTAQAHRGRKSALP